MLDLTRSGRHTRRWHSSSSASATTIRACRSATPCGTRILQRKSNGERRTMTLVRKIAALYAVLLALAAATNYVPGLTDAQGRAFGIFALDIYDDALHLASAAWAAIAAYPLDAGGDLVPAAVRDAVPT